VTVSADAAWIRFRAGDGEYALPLDVVSEVTVARRPRLIPFVPIERAGVINMKGEPLVVVDGRALLGGDPERRARHALVLERGVTRVGLLVDFVVRIERDLDSRARDSQEDPDPSVPAFVRRRTVDGESLGFLDPDALLDCVEDLLTTRPEPVQQEGEDPWPNAF
jgi:chemotaxis signal transduction protein